MRATVGHGGTGGLFTAAALTAGFVVFFPLAAVGQMASLAFLIVYGTVSLGHLLYLIVTLEDLAELNQNGLGRAAIDVDVLSSYPLTIVRGQEYHHRGNVLVGVTHSPQGILRGLI